MNDNVDYQGAGQADLPAPEPATTPVTTEGSLNQAGAIAIIMQVVAAIGILISFMGLGENHWLRQLWQFANSSDAVPIIGVLATAIVWIVTWLRARRRSSKLAFMASLLPNRVAQVTGPLHPKVAAAVEEAKSQASPFDRRVI